MRVEMEIDGVSYCEFYITRQSKLFDLLEDASQTANRTKIPGVKGLFFVNKRSVIDAGAGSSWFKGILHCFEINRAEDGI
jgi:hypothetical protein